MKHPILAVLVLFAISVSSTAQDNNPQSSKSGLKVYFHGFSAEHIVQFCRAGERSADGMVPKDDAYNLGACFGYIYGLLDTVDVMQALEVMPKKICVPSVPKVTSTQLAKVVVKYGDDHPESLHLSAQMLVYPALEKAFPCE